MIILRHHRVITRRIRQFTKLIQENTTKFGQKNFQKIFQKIFLIKNERTFGAECVTYRRWNYRTDLPSGLTEGIVFLVFNRRATNSEKLQSGIYGQK